MTTPGSDLKITLVGIEDVIPDQNFTRM
jgi:hypothetical protein